MNNFSSKEDKIWTDPISLLLILKATCPPAAVVIISIFLMLKFSPIF